MIRVLLTALILCSPGGVVAQSSNAARYLLKENIAEGCTEGTGHIDPRALIEADLDGDGRDDLIIAHEGIRCGTSDTRRSLLCGMQVCSVKIYMRRGDLLRLQEDFLGSGIAVNDNAMPPIVSGYAHGGGKWSLRWSGAGFR